MGRFLDVNGVRLHYVERGTGDAVVLLHGNGSMIQDFESSGLIDLAAKDFRVVVFDRPGFGHSERPRGTVWTPDAQAELIKAALTQLGVSRAIILGHSWGASVAVAMGLKYPDLVRRFEGKAAPPTLMEVREAVREIRASKGMLIVEGDPDCRSAGSFFKNPILPETDYVRLQSRAQETVPRYPAGTGMVKTSAAWLIERAGFKKGFAVGPAGVSTKHTLALVNRGGAKASDIVHLAREIRSGVQDAFGVRLVPEPVFVGFDEEF